MGVDLGKTQSYARKINNKLVINRLRISPASATMLVEELELSNSAISSILKQLEGSGIIIQSHSMANFTKGRKQVYYTLNKDYGMFVILCLSNNRCKIIISNIKEEVLYKEEHEIDKYDVAVIYELILKVKKLLHEKYINHSLAGIYIALPGKVNSKTGELQLSKHFDKDIFEEENKIKKLFSSHFDAPIIIENDTNLAIIGEKCAGALQNSEDALLIYVDNGIGSSMILNGNFYTGAFGYAGEIGLMEASFNGDRNYLDEFVSIRSIKKYIKDNFNLDLVTKDVIDKYYEDEKIHNYIIETAKVLGKKIKDIIEFLNISKVAIQGRVTHFGSDYLNAIKAEIAKSQNICDICYSNLNGDSIFLGAMSLAVDNLIDFTTNKLEINETNLYKERGGNR